jgi:hypothetical protein
MEGLHARLYDPTRSRRPEVERNPNDESVASGARGYARTSNSGRVVPAEIGCSRSHILGDGTTEGVLRRSIVPRAT